MPGGDQIAGVLPLCVQRDMLLGKLGLLLRSGGALVVQRLLEVGDDLILGVRARGVGLQQLLELIDLALQHRALRRLFLPGSQHQVGVVVA